MLKRVFIMVMLPLAFASCSSVEESSVKDDDNIEGEAPVEMSAGQKLFVNNCIQCHNVKTDKIGPKLEGVAARWDNDTARLYAFIKNSQQAVKAGDPRAEKVYKEWNNTMMTPMPHLTNGDIQLILDYINTAAE